MQARARLAGWIIVLRIVYSLASIGYSIDQLWIDDPHRMLVGHQVSIPKSDILITQLKEDRFYTLPSAELATSSLLAKGKSLTGEIASPSCISSEVYPRLVLQ